MAAAGAGGGADDELTVLGAWASPFLVRVRLALHLKALEYEYVEVDLKEKSDLLLASNPVHKKVPVLLHGGKPVCESMLIVQYLDDAFPRCGPAFLPADPHDRAVARFWAAYVDDKLLSSWMGIFATTTGEEKAEAVERTLEAVDELEGAFRECSGGKDWFGGDNVGYVDIALGGFVPAMNASEPTTGLKIVDPVRTPLLTAWKDRFCAFDAAKAAMPPTERLIEIGKKRQAELQVAEPEQNE
uniref:Uncharacterized protein n=1 Tax=Avena sativa TaxID=4498 RepID=A0ACD5YJB9_AVESA